MKIKFLTTGMSTFLAILTASPLATAVSPSAETVLDDLTTTTNSITFQGDNYSLLDTYVSANDARRIYTTRYADALNEIQDQEMLPPLDPHSASSYKQVVIAKSTNTRENMEPLVEFLDIYENSEENAQIVDHLNKLEIQIANNELTREDASIQARILLPSKPENGNEQLSYSTRNSGINLTNARAYARKWAVNINPKYGEEKNWWGQSVDCTNFISQILFAGGISMDTYNDETKGWWWKSIGNRSISWVNANTFKNYMGSGYNTKYWSSLVSNVRDGDFIAVDYVSDGDVDHAGFVYSKNGTRLRIAQHTRNYLDWNHGWADHNGKGTYYRVRR